MPDDPYQAALDHWIRKEIPVLKPYSEGEVRTVFAALRQPLSRDVLRLYTTLGGFDDFECDGAWCLWHLERVVEMAPYRDQWRRDNDILWFADHLIESEYFGLKYLNEHHSLVCIDSGGDPGGVRECAGSIDEFLSKYVQHPGRVFAMDCGEYFFSSEPEEESTPAPKGQVLKALRDFFRQREK